MHRKILVTGGAGFIGSHLCHELLREGNEVLCLDNLVTGNIDNIRNLFSDPNFEFIRHDITTPLFVEVDQIYNLACPASPIHYQFDPIKTVKTNFLGAMHTLGLAKRTGARILQSSTSEVYGDPLVHPQVETYRGNVNQIGPRSCYDEGKRVAETLFFEYHRQHNVDIRVLRIFNTYGPNMQTDDGRVVSNFIIQALQDEDITIYGNGEQTRSFCYISDLLQGMIAYMEKDEPEMTGPLNIGNPTETTMIELAEMIIRLIDSKSKIVFKPLPQDDPRRRKPDISLIQQKINWTPKVPLEEGLKETIAYFTALVRG